MLEKIEALIRKSISEEQLAVYDYLKRKHKLEEMLEEDEGNLGDKLQVFISTLDDIISEEKIHIGQLTEMLDLFQFSKYNEEKGKKEAREEIDSSFISTARKLRPYLKERE